jgi:hypothetical protein
MIVKIFELNDITNEETYFPLGVWDSLEEAIFVVNQCKTPADFPNDNEIDDYFKIEIRERPIGWCGSGKKVLQREYLKKYVEDTDEFVWDIR